MVVSKSTKKIASNTIYQIIGKFFSMMITVLATVIITRAYGREGYGIFSLMQAWPALFFVIADFGINAIATRELSKDWGKAQAFLGNILFIRLAFSLILIAFLCIVIVFFPYSTDVKMGVMLGLLLILTQSLYATTNIVFQVKLRYDLSTVGYIAGYVVILAAVLALSYFRAHPLWINFSYVIGGVLTFLINFAFWKKLGVTPSLRFDKNVWKFLFAESLPLGLMFVFSQINWRSDAILMSVLKMPARYGLNNNESVAIYSLPYKVFEVMLVVPTFFMNSAYPVMVRHLQEGKKKFLATFAKIMTFLAISGVFCGFIGVLFSPLAVRFLGGAEFSQSVFVLSILSFGLVLYFLTQPIAWMIVTVGKHKYLPWIYLASAVLNVGANLVFIPKYSFYASALITHVSELLVLVLLVLYAIRAWKLKYD